MSRETPRSGEADVAALAGMLREVCAAVLAARDCPPDLAGWCLRMLAEPGAAERAVKAVSRRIG